MHKTNHLAGIENVVGYIFKDKKLLKSALTHKSCGKQVSENYERLEFIGDSVVGLAASCYLFEKYDNVTEGELSKMKDSLVSLEACTRYAEYFALDKYMMHCKGMKDRARYFKGDLFESLIGAIYVDGGFDIAYKFFTNLLQEIIKIHGMPTSKSYIAVLQEYSHKHFKKIPEYELVSEEGPDHKKMFFFNVFLNGEKKGYGKGRCKKTAKEDAAENALKNIGEE